MKGLLFDSLLATLLCVFAGVPWWAGLMIFLLLRALSSIHVASLRIVELQTSLDIATAAEMAPDERYVPSELSTSTSYKSHAPGEDAT